LFTPISALTSDTEEFVIEKVLNALASLTELGLFSKSSVLDLSKTIIKLVVHPNIWISNGAIGFLATSAKTLGVVDTRVLLYPIIRPYLICDISGITEQKLIDYKQKPVSIPCSLNIPCNFGIQFGLNVLV
jgi:phosphoinositide-3-kinase, regulatory subunit 4